MAAAFLAAPSPRLPRLGWTRRAISSAGAAVLQVVLAGLLAVLSQPSVRRAIPAPATVDAAPPIELPRLVFVAPKTTDLSGGGGGGGNRQPGPIRRALGPGAGDVTLRTMRPRVVRPPTAPPEHSALESPLVALDARPLSGGSGNQIGLPVGGASTGTSTGPGSGGGVGTGQGTGIGPGAGPGFGPGSGGGIGGGVYRPGGAVSSPVLLQRFVPSYTPDALRNRIEGTVWLETVVGRDGRTSRIRVLRSLDEDLDREAIKALAQWQFEPGRLSGAPVDVAVSVAMDFRIR